MNIANRQPNWAKTKLATAILPLSLLLGGCGDDNLDPNAINAPDEYYFDSKTSPGESSVDYSEATTRLILIKELEYLIGSDYLNEYGVSGNPTAVLNLLNRVYQLGTSNLKSSNIYSQSNVSTTIQAVHTTKPKLQTTYASLPSGIQLKNAMPGISKQLNYRDAENIQNGYFIGWDINLLADEDLVPDAMIQEWFKKIADLTVDDNPNTQFSNFTLDYKTLVTAFLTSSITYSQVTQIHLNPSIGLMSANNSDGKSTPLQHHWDMAFGYFGAHTNYLSTRTENSSSNEFDNNGDGKINLLSEYNFDSASNSAYIDSTSYLASTQFSNKIAQAFLTGRQLIDDNVNDESPEFRQQLNELSSVIKSNWEKMMAAHIIRRLNRAIFLLQTYVYDDNIVFDLYKKDWAEIKSYAMALQLNPNAIIQKDDLETIHFKLGKSTNTADTNGYANKLYAVKKLLGTVYDFSDQNIESWE